MRTLFIRRGIFILRSAERREAFSLVELLIVVGLIVIMLSLAVPAVNTVMISTNLNRGGQAFVDQIILARQMALTRNRDIEVRFWELTNSSTQGYRAIQLWLVDENGTNRFPLTRITQLPEGIIINTNPNLSPLLFGPNVPIRGETNFPSYGKARYVGFRYRANGEADISIGSGGKSASNFLTIQHFSSEADTLPPNFYGIQVNPLTGRVTTYRP